MGDCFQFTVRHQFSGQRWEINEPNVGCQFLAREKPAHFSFYAHQPYRVPNSAMPHRKAASMVEFKHR
jgi:hypothetical protein